MNAHTSFNTDSSTKIKVKIPFWWPHFKNLEDYGDATMRKAANDAKAFLSQCSVRRVRTPSGLHCIFIYVVGCICSQDVWSLSFPVNCNAFWAGHPSSDHLHSHLPYSWKGQQTANCFLTPSWPWQLYQGKKGRPRWTDETSHCRNIMPDESAWNHLRQLDLLLVNNALPTVMAEPTVATHHSQKIHSQAPTIWKKPLEKESTEMITYSERTPSERNCCQINNTVSLLESRE